MNMAIDDGAEQQRKIYFFDFAFSEFYVDAMGKPKRREKADDMNGSPNFFAMDPLRMQTHVRKDELISFGICLLDMNNANLPWTEKTKGITDIFKAMSIVLSEWEKHGIEVSQTLMH